MSKLTKVLLFSGGSDSVLISHLYEPDYLVYINMHTRYSEEEINKIENSAFANDPRLRIIDFPFLGQYEREDAIIPLRNLYLYIICDHLYFEDILRRIALSLFVILRRIGIRTTGIFQFMSTVCLSIYLAL